MLQVSSIPSMYKTVLCCMEGQGLSGASCSAVGEHPGLAGTAGEGSPAGQSCGLPCLWLHVPELCHGLGSAAQQLH